MIFLNADNMYPSNLFIDLHISVREHNHRFRSQSTDPFFREKITDRICLRPCLLDKVLLERFPVALQQIPVTDDDSPVAFRLDGEDPFRGDDDMVDVPLLGYKIMNNKITRREFPQRITGILFRNSSTACIEGPVRVRLRLVAHRFYPVEDADEDNEGGGYSYCCDCLAALTEKVDAREHDDQEEERGQPPGGFHLSDPNPGLVEYRRFRRPGSRHPSLSAILNTPVQGGNTGGHDLGAYNLVARPSSPNLSSEEAVTIFRGKKDLRVGCGAHRQYNLLIIKGNKKRIEESDQNYFLMFLIGYEGL